MVGPTTPVGMGSTYLEYALCTWGMEKRYHRVICKKQKPKKKNHGNNRREMRDTEKNRERSKQLTCHADRGAERGGGVVKQRQGNQN